MLWDDDINEIKIAAELINESGPVLTNVHLLHHVVTATLREPPATTVNVQSFLRFSLMLCVFVVINHVPIFSQKKNPDTLITPYSCVFSHNNLALSCKDSPACDLCVSGREYGGSWARTRPGCCCCYGFCFSTSSSLSCCLCVISVNFLILFSPSLFHNKVHMLLFIKAGGELGNICVGLIPVISKNSEIAENIW